MRKQYAIIGFLAFMISSTFYSCRKKNTDEFVRDAPIVTFANNRTERAVINNLDIAVQIPVKVQAIGKITSLKVFRNVNDQDETQIDEITTFTDEFSSVVNYVFNTKAAYQVGNKVNLKFVATDKNGKSNEGTIFTINISSSLFSISQEVINGNTVTVLAPPNTSTNVTLINFEEFTFEGNKKYLIKGLVQFEEGSKVTIQAGTQIYAKTGEAVLPAFIISPSVKVNALGTKDAPILFSSDKKLTGVTPAQGDWQGLAIYGKAKVNTGNQIGIGNISFGGDDDNDSSGVFRYIRVEYAGGGTGTGAAEAAGIHLGGVGKKTEISFMQTHMSGLHGFLVNGGTVNLRYMIATNSKEHQFNFERGWRGLGQFWVTAVDNVAPDASVGAQRGIQISSYPGPAVVTDIPSSFIISNVTLTGPGFAIGASPFDAIGFRFRRAAEGKLYNALITQFGSSGARIDSDVATQSFDGRLELRNSSVFQNSAGPAHTNNFHSSTRPATPSITTGQNWRDNLIYQNYITPITMTGFVGTSTTDPFNISSLNNAWFINASYRGAIDPANDWTADGSWCVGLDGTIR